jgi:GNAT superfamily N-acetyltransferase
MDRFVRIEQASPSDTGEIRAMVLDLAEYEGLAHTLVMSEEMLYEALFGPQPAARALVARCAGDTAGFALYFHTFSTFTGRRGIWVEDLFVKRAYRRRGIGSRLMRRVASIAYEEKCGRLEWSALHWNEPAIRLYRASGARALSEWDTYRLEEREIEAVALGVTTAAAKEDKR